MWDAISKARPFAQPLLQALESRRIVPHPIRRASPATFPAARRRERAIPGNLPRPNHHYAFLAITFAGFCPFAAPKSKAADAMAVGAHIG